MSHAGYRTIKLLAGENFRERKIVFTTPPDATSISIHYLHASVKKKCYGTDLPELLLQRIEVGLSGLFLPILILSGPIMDLLVGLSQGFAENC